jgi:hypothetical protein
MRLNLQDIHNEEKLTRASGTQNSSSSNDSEQTISTVSTKSTRRRRTEKVASSAKMLLKQDTEVFLTFD